MSAHTTTPCDAHPIIPPISPNTRDYDRGYWDGYWDLPMPTRRSLDYVNGYSDGIADNRSELGDSGDSEIPF